jgi:hypothetical protein
MRDKICLFGQEPNERDAKSRVFSASFKDDENGSLVIFSVFMVLMILMVGGIGINLMRSERDRTVLQHTLDRAVLAAADLDQDQAPETVVNDYFAAAGLQKFLTSVDVSSGIAHKTVGATAQSITHTTFMNMSGVDTLNATAYGVAEERVPLVEISLVLDISGSMAEGNKMQELRDAASGFVDAVLRPGNEEQVSVSLVPYSEQVNLGEPLFNQLKQNHDHNFSYCIEFEHGDFDKAHLNRTQTYYQAQHFQWNYSGSNEVVDTICPQYTYEAIKPISNDAVALKNQIALLQPRAGTQIFLGMKWGAALLDPDFRPITSNLAIEGEVPSVYAQRPLEYDDTETLKTIVLMTDGKNSKSSRLREPAYNSTSDYAHWDRYNLWHYLTRYVSSNKRYRYYREKYSALESDVYTQSICSAAKTQGVVIWTIGFEVDAHGASVMQDCASSPSHFFEVEGIEISEAFDAIARQINQLRLTQ